MIIGIEAERANNPVKTGVEYYAKYLILNLAQLDKVNKYVLYLRTAPEYWLKNLPSNFSLKVIPFPVFWTQIRVSLEIFLHPVDVLMIPASALPLVHPKKSVVTIHDIAWKFYPETFTLFNRLFLELSTRFALSAAEKIIAVSEATRQDLIKFYKIDPRKIAVVHHGYEISDKCKVTSGKSAGLPTTHYQLPTKFVLFISTLQPRKNLEGLIDAVKTLRNEEQALFDYKLVIVGKPGWKFEKILKKIEENRDFVVYLNHVSDQEKNYILSQAELLVLPSFYEGFGMQILESLAAGVPVATSNISSMPEVAGDAAVYFNPHSTMEIKNAIKAVLMDKSLADSLKQKARVRLENFSWKKCAEETLKVLINS